MLVTLDDSLKPIAPYRPEAPMQVAVALSDRKYDHQTKQYVQSLFPCWDELDGDIGHNGYLEYLEHCWGHHCGVVLSPDIVWQTLLGEVASIVATDPEGYRHLFSESKGKREIIVYGHPRNPEWMHDVMSHLRKLVPAGTDVFVPTFSTTTAEARLARNAMFCSLVSPYYCYSIFCCGIPRVDFLGTPEDWEKVRYCWSSIGNLLHGEDAYFSRVENILAGLHEQSSESSLDKNFFKGMFFMERCGSGSQQEARGWFTELFREKPSLCFSKNFPTGLARVDFHNLEDGEDYQSVLGILSSRERGDGVREPLFGHVLFEKRIVG